MTITHSSLIGDVVTIYYADTPDKEVAESFIFRNYLNAESAKHTQTSCDMLLRNPPIPVGFLRYKVTFKPETK